MEHCSKKRKLAPKLPSPLSSDARLPHHSRQTPEQVNYSSAGAGASAGASTASAFATVASRIQLPPAHPGPNFAQSDSADFGSFARHLQDAALYIQSQAASATTSYKDVSVLIIRWENDAYNVQDSMDLESVFHHQFGYRIEPCMIPVVQNPFAKLGTQIGAFLDSKPGNLLIVYYSGYSYQDHNGQLYWAK